MISVHPVWTETVVIKIHVIHTTSC